MSTIRVNNYLDEKIKVSVNQWGRGGNTSRWTLSAATGEVPTDEAWDHEDERGFIMTIAKEGTDYADVPYFVHADANIEVKAAGITSGGVTIDPVGSIPPDGAIRFTLSVRDDTEEKISVSINQWGKRGNTSDWDIKSGDTKAWEREDVRGFVMTVSVGVGATRCYYVHSDSVIVVSDDEVTDRGEPIESIGSPTSGA